MIDTISVKRPQTTATDATWDESHGCWIPNPGTPGEIYNGVAVVASKGWTPQEQLDAGAANIVAAYKISTPIGSAQFKQDDIVTVLTSVRSLALVGTVYIVKAPIASTYEIQQQVFAEVFDPARPR